MNLPRYGNLGAAQLHTAGYGNAAWRSTTAPRTSTKGLVSISQKTLDEIEDWMKSLDYSIKAVRIGMAALAGILARVQHNEARARSSGVYDPYRQRSNYAWKIPVRQISRQFYVGWKLQRIDPQTFRVYNDSREAYYIEFGIHTGTNRVRRPIRKLSLIWTLRWAEKSRIYYRVWDDVFQPRRSGRLGMTGTTAGLAYAGVGVQSPAQNIGGLMGGNF